MLRSLSSWDFVITGNMSWVSSNIQRNVGALIPKANTSLHEASNLHDSYQATRQVHPASKFGKSLEKLVIGFYIVPSTVVSP